MCSYRKLKLIPRALVVNLHESNLFLADNLSCGEFPHAVVQHRCSQRKKTRWQHINMQHIIQPRDPEAGKMFFFSFFSPPPPKSKPEAVLQTANYGRKPFISCVHHNGKSARQCRKSNANLRGGTRLKRHPARLLRSWLTAADGAVSFSLGAALACLPETIWNSTIATQRQHTHFQSFTCIGFKSVCKSGKFYSALHLVRTFQSGDWTNQPLWMRRGWS